MDTLQSANRLMKKNCYRASLDLRDAHYSASIDEEVSYVQLERKITSVDLIANGLFVSYTR